MPANDDLYFPGKRRVGFQIRFQLESLCYLSVTLLRKSQFFATERHIGTDTLGMERDGPGCGTEVNLTIPDTSGT